VMLKPAYNLTRQGHHSKAEEIALVVLSPP
jgi:hypothetical protein